MADQVIDLSSDDEDVQQPFNKGYAVDIVEGIEVYQFMSEVEMEFFSIHETQPSRDEKFFGFDVKNQPSTVLMDLLNSSKAKDPRLASHRVPISDPVASSVGLLSTGITSGAAQDLNSDDNGKQQLVDKRYIVDIIDGIEIYQFTSEIEMEFHANHAAFPTLEDDEFLGFDVENKPSTVYIDFFKSKIKEPRLGSRCISISDQVPKSVLGATASPVLASTEMSANENNVDDDDCVIVFSDIVVPIPKSVCNNCGKPKNIQKKYLLSKTEVISLDSDDENEDAADAPAPNPKHGCSNYNDTEPKMSAKSSIYPPKIEDETPSERATLIISGSCSLASEHDYAVSQQKSDIRTTSLLAVSTVADDIICLDSDDDTSRVEVSTTKTLFDSMLKQGNEKTNDFQSKPIRNSEATATPTINAPISQTLDQMQLKEIEGVVKHIVDFVCRQEEIANIPVLMEPYDKSYSNSCQYQNMPPCWKEYCAMGCVCHCIRRKFKRMRCENHQCIFGCSCFSLLRPRKDPSSNGKSGNQRFDVKYDGNFSASTEVIPFKHRRNTFESNNNERESAIVHRDPTQKNCVIPPKHSHQKQTQLSVKEISPLDCIILKPQSTKYNMTLQPKEASKNIGKKAQQPLWKSNSLFKKKKFRSNSLNLQQVYRNNMFQKHPIMAREHIPKVPVQSAQKIRDLASAGGPPPAFALTCLTPGIGYIALEEFGSSMLRLHDPFEPSCSNKFSSVSLAADWLNCRLREYLEFDQGVELKWLVANSVMIQRKKIKCFDRNVLMDPRCRITRHGVLFI